MDDDGPNECGTTGPIPLTRRRRLIFPALAWSGFSSAFASIVVGSRLQESLGTLDALIASILGSWILFVYSAAIGFAAGRWGLSSQLVLEAVFGRWGAVAPGVVLGALVTSWYGFHVALTASILSAAMPLPMAPELLVCVIGLVFAAPTILRLSHGFNLTAIAIPAMTLFAALVSVDLLAPRWSTLLDGPIGGTMAFGTGVCVAFGTFVVSATMTGDIVRFCRTGSEAVQATAYGFLLSNFPFMLVGVLIAGANLRIIDVFTGHGPLAWVLLILAVISNWTTSDACLTNAGVTFLQSFKGLRWSGACAVAMLLGLLIALTGATGDALQWTLTLTAIAAPIGGVIVADYYVLRVRVGFSRERKSACNSAALLAVGTGVAISFAGQELMSGAFTPLLAIPAAGCTYLLLVALIPNVLGARLGLDKATAEAID